MFLLHENCLVSPFSVSNNLEVIQFHSTFHIEDTCIFEDTWKMKYRGKMDFTQTVLQKLKTINCWWKIIENVFFHFTYKLLDSNSCIIHYMKLRKYFYALAFHVTWKFVHLAKSHLAQEQAWMIDIIRLVCCSCMSLCMNTFTCNIDSHQWIYGMIQSVCSRLR